MSVLSYKNIVISLLLLSLSSFSSATTQHGLSMHGDLKYPADFTHFDYTNPDANKGGDIKEWALGTFDSFNGFIIKGTSADGLGLIYDSLMSKSLDEPFSQYGLLAKTVDMPESREFVTFTLHPEAMFSDGVPVTASDVVFTFDLLLNKGSPFYKAYLGDIDKVEAINEHIVKFHFKPTGNRELPLIVGEIPILPAHYWKNHDFSSPSLDIPVGSGPYVLASYDAGRAVTFKRNPDYWGKDLAVNKGRYNFGSITYDYYRDTTVSLEAFKAGEYDFRQETSSKQWATGYTGPQFDSGDIIKQEIKHSRPTGMQAFVFNTRRDIFKDPRVRKALSYAFDFEWTNQNLFYNAYTRTHSYFSNSDMAATALPSADELAILEPLRGTIPDEVFTRVYNAPTYNGSGHLRKEQREALRTLKAAGWNLINGKLLNAKSGQPMTFEILLVQKEFERVVSPMIKNLNRIGVDVSIRIIDVSQYINRIRAFDFDMVVGSFGQSSSPGNEQREFWGSENADKPGSRNIIGIQNPAVDQLIEQIIQAKDRHSLVLSSRALDRVLQWNYYVIPQFHSSSYRIAYKNIFSFPEIKPLFDLGFDTWWVKDLNP
ncbi:extracellular solute-binding protein [Neptunomonas antarctica]|uniref:Microcin C transport system substrate-binding protein n=1 Tax=Neptunomonas antarctica TaxID=619304 RepID=A0A1N7LSM8_9GAMM|nr:extracellular solute-binding protein [Neptunomonas antarctica]SIS76762.1 microcin C transport system substrate-binding protein [Neptunomonas antarctica]